MHDDSGEGIPQALAHDLIHLMAQQKMVVETQHILSRCQADDAMVVVGSDVKLRLDILAIDEELENTLLTDDQKHPSKNFERLLDRFDILTDDDELKLKTQLSSNAPVSDQNLLVLRTSNQRKNLLNADNAVITEKWPTMRAALVRQAALSYLRAQERDHVGPGLFSWSNVSIQGYIQFVNQLIPRVDVDLDSLDDEEQMMQEKERRNLEDVFLEKRRSVSSIKIRTLLKENKLEIFEEDMKAFTRSLDSALLPKPRLLQIYSGSGILDENLDVADSSGLEAVPGGSMMGTPAKKQSRRKRGPLATSSKVPENAEALAKATEHLQKAMEGHPGTVAEALAVGERMLERHSPPRERKAAKTAKSDGAADARVVEPARKRGKMSIMTRSSLGEQVSFDDSQNVDEPRSTRPTLSDRPTPQKRSVLKSPVSTPSSINSTRVKKKKQRVRNPWTDEEVAYLHAAVKSVGKGNWTLALSQFKFQDFRTAVDLKDKWRNLTK